jgi:hypothetical protein
MYSLSGFDPLLIEKQTVNISSVWGPSLFIGDVSINNGLDALMLEIYDIGFKVG